MISLRSIGGAILILLLCLSGVWAEGRRYLSGDETLLLETSEEFHKTFNPHAILSLQSPDKILVVVTVRKSEYSVQELFDGAPSSFPDGSECMGRVLMTVDGEQAPTFLVEGMFPPDEVATHSTLYTMVNHSDLEYTIMIHYPLHMEQEGFEFAASLLGGFHWLNRDEKP